MITELYKKIKRGYFGSILNDIFTRKRSLNDDSDEEEENNPILIEPPFKRSRYTQEESRIDIHQIGSARGSRTSDGNTYFLPSKLSPASSSYFEMNSRNNEVEFLGGKKKMSPLSPKYNVGGALQSGSQLKSKAYQSPILSTFKFSPSITSTINRPTSVGLGITKRKPIKSASLISEKIYEPTPSKGGIQKRFGEVSRFTKKRSALSIIQSTGTRNLLTANESFRLDDKERYRQLIQQYTSSNVTSSDIGRRSFLSSPLSKPSSSDAASRTGAIFKTHLDPVATCKSRILLEREEVCPTPSLPSRTILSKTPGRSLKALPSSSIPFIDLEPLESHKKEIEELDDDIFIVKEVSPQKPRNNSLEDKLQKSSFYNDSWLKDFQQYYTDKNRARDADIEVIVETKKKCEQSRIDCENVLLEKVAKRISQLDIKYPIRVTEVKDEEEDELPELSPEIEDLINRALKVGPPGQVLADKFNIQITRRDLHTLSGLNWLNDEVINFYMNMLMERGENDNFPKVYAFNTFFYSKLVKMGYASVKRWTKKVDIFSFDLLIVPVHLGMHWCLATIDFRDKAVRYYDSMLGDNNKCLAELKKYLGSEHQDKKKSSYNDNSLTTTNVKDIPQQMNGSDCGMFSCKFAEYLSRDAPITFTQEHMPYFRRRMVYEILMRRLM